MTSNGRVDWRRAAATIVRTYAAELRGWAAGLTMRYIAAAATALGGILTVFAAGAVGVAALFHFIEEQYGLDAAYASVGGGLFVVGLSLLLFAWILLRRGVSAPPRPLRQAQSVKRMFIEPVAGRAIASFHQAEGSRADPLTQVLAAAAATMLVGWIVASRLERRSQRSRVKR